MSDLHTPSSTGLSAPMAGALAYLLGPITGIAFLVMEKQSRFVRFHAMQSTLVWAAVLVVNIALSVFSSVLSHIPFIGWLFALGIGLVFSLACFALWLAMMYMAFQGRRWEMPVVGEYARSFSEGPLATG
jgi:uncharacterized membrane protein